MTIADASAPARKGAPMPRAAQAEYSEASTPSQTGDQYRQYAATKGTATATNQPDLPGRAQHQTLVSSTETTAIMATLEPSDKDSSNVLMANARAEWCRAEDVRMRTERQIRHPLQRDS